MKQFFKPTLNKIIFLIIAIVGVGLFVLGQMAGGPVPIWETGDPGLVTIAYSLHWPLILGYTVHASIDNTCLGYSKDGTHPNWCQHRGSILDGLSWFGVGLTIFWLYFLVCLFAYIVRRFTGQVHANTT